MLNNKQKKTDKNTKQEFNVNLQSMRSWIRKVEQSTNSVSSRLSAVEKRISSNKELVDNPVFGRDGVGITQILKQTKNQDNVDSSGYIQAAGKLLESKIMMIQQELSSQQHEINSVKEKLESIDVSLKSIKQDFFKSQENSQGAISQVSNRVERIERREPFILQFLGLEIPLEIAGVIAGLIAFVAAFFVGVGLKDFLISPVFLVVVGFVFIAAALFKTLKFNDFFKRKKKDFDTVEHSVVYNEQ